MHIPYIQGGLAMRKKCIKRIVVVMALVFATMTTSCKPMNVEKVDSYKFVKLIEKWKEIPPNEIEKIVFEEVSESFKIDAKISISEELEEYRVPTLKLHRMLFDDKERTLKYLLDICEWNEELLDDTERWITDDKLENGQNESAIQVQQGREENEIRVVQIRDRNILILDELSNKYAESEWMLTANHDPSVYSERKNLNYISINKDLDFMTAELAEKYVKDVFRDLGIESELETVVYSLSVGDLKKVADIQQAYYDEIGWTGSIVEQNISKEDEAYYIVLYQSNNKIPLVPFSMSNQVTNSYHTGSQNSVLFSANGIQSMNISNVYNMEDTGEVNTILTLGDVLEMHYERYGSILTRKEVVKEIKLYYLPVCTNKDNLEFTARPVWYIQSDITTETAYGDEIMGQGVIYDAVTGEELAW